MNELFGKRLAELRREKDFSQRELAKELGMTRSALSMYELGKSEPNFEVVDTLADYFDVDLRYLLGYQEDKGHYPRHGDDDPAPDVAAVISAYVRAPEKTKLMVRMLLGIEEGH